MPKHNGDPRLHDATRLSDLGIDKTQSHRCQRIAELPEESFERHVAEVRGAGEELTTAGVLRLAREAQQPGKQQDPSADGSRWTIWAEG
jgi:hypothetical protein